MCLKCSLCVQDQADPMSGMSLLAGKALSSARMSDILSQTSLTGSQQLHQREESGQLGDIRPSTFKYT